MSWRLSEVGVSGEAVVPAVGVDTPLEEDEKKPAPPPPEPPPTLCGETGAEEQAEPGCELKPTAKPWASAMPRGTRRGEFSRWS